MKLTRSLLTCLILSSTASAAFAAAPATPASAKKDATPPAAPAPAPAPTPAPSGFTLDVYIKDLTDQLKLSDTEKQEIQTDYVNDGPKLKGILNDDTLSPFQQAQQVADLRNERNAKIEVLLDDLGRKQLFLQIEAKYRVALTLLAADGALVAAPAPAAPAKTS
jgi:hypothetical protein